MKQYGKYIIYMTIISFVALLSIKLTNNANNKIEDKPSRIIVKSPKNENNLYSKEIRNNEGFRVTVPAANGKSLVQPLPVPDTNLPIIFTPLS